MRFSIETPVNQKVNSALNYLNPSLNSIWKKVKSSALTSRFNFLLYNKETYFKCFSQTNTIKHICNKFGFQLIGMLRTNTKGEISI